MKRSAFASLCGIVKSMVSKYESQGCLVVVDGEIDAPASLVALEGRLDEAKRQRALQVLGAPGAARSAPPPSSQPTSRGAKAEKDEIERDLKRLQFAREAGDVVRVAEVEDAAISAVMALREAFANRKRETASRICAMFGIPPEKATALARALSDEFEAALGVFSAAMDRVTDEGVAAERTVAAKIEPSVLFA